MVLYATVATSGGCGGKTSHLHGGPDEVAEGCKHLDYGEADIIDTTVENSTQLAVHFRYALTLDETDEGVYAGSVPYTSAGGHHYILLKNRADVAIADSRGAAIEPLSVQADGMISSCGAASLVGAITGREYVFTFTQATQRSKWRFMSKGPTMTTSITMGIEQSETRLETGE